MTLEASQITNNVTDCMFNSLFMLATRNTHIPHTHTPPLPLPHGGSVVREIHRYPIDSLQGAGDAHSVPMSWLYQTN